MILTVLLLVPLAAGIASFLAGRRSAVEAISLISSNLLPTLSMPDNANFRGRMMLASLDAGLAFSNASLGMVHAMAHSLGGMLDSPHGECNALLLPHVIDFNFGAVPDRYRQIAEAMGIAITGMTPEEIRATLHHRLDYLRIASGNTYTLSQLGVTRGDIPELAAKALADPTIFTNPRQPTMEDIEAIYERAL